MFVSGEGITLGAHRMYSHKAFRGSFIVRLVVIVLHTIAGQVSQQNSLQKVNIWTVMPWH